MLGMIAKPLRLALSLAMVVVFIWIAAKVGIPMYNQWRETGKVSVPSVSDLKLDELKDRASEYIPELDNIPGVGTGNPSGSGGIPSGSTGSGAEALAALNTLPVKGKAPKTGIPANSSAQHGRTRHQEFSTRATGATPETTSSPVTW